MFSNLGISKAEGFEKHLNQYDVLHWDIQWCMEPAGGPEKIVSYISEQTISELKEYYPHILPEKNPFAAGVSVTDQCSNRNKIYSDY